LHVVGMVEDRLYPIRLQRALVELAPKKIELDVVHSIVGHDAFLTEDEVMSSLLRRMLG
jgi:homoserine O-acetyltransferase/O-succinyltransferase